MLTRALAPLTTLALLAAGLVGTTATAAHADGGTTCQQTDWRGQCTVWAGTSGGGGGRGTGVGGGHSDGGGGGSPVVTIVVHGQTCVPGGLASSPPPKSYPVWEGHTDGAIYECYVSRHGVGITPGVTLTLQYWAASAPAAPPPPDPRQLARQAIQTMQLHAGGIGIVPEDQPGRVGIIGMPTWMWVTDPGPATVGPITRTASARGYTVTATARVTRIVWAMGDGTHVTCAGPGTPYADRYGKQDSPTCGHRYTQTGTYPVTATSHWTVTWAGIGQTGTIPLDLSRSTRITMGEVQVLTQ